MFDLFCHFYYYQRYYRNIEKNGFRSEYYEFVQDGYRLLLVHQIQGLNIIDCRGFLGEIVVRQGEGWIYKWILWGRVRWVSIKEIKILVLREASTLELVPETNTPGQYAVNYSFNKGTIMECGLFYTVNMAWWVLGIKLWTSGTRNVTRLNSCHSN